MFTLFTSKGKAVPVQAYYWPIAFLKSEASRLLECRHMKMVILTALLTGHLYT